MRVPVKNIGLYLGMASSLAGVAAQPVIGNEGQGAVWRIVNAASYAPQGLPNSSIAQGSIFAIFGTGLGPTTGVQVSAFPLATTFQGVSISVSQGGDMVAAIPLYVSATQINAVMPSSAPIGSDTVAVTFHGQTSSALCSTECPSATVQVVPASFGIFTVNQAGNGQGVITNGNDQAISYASPATAGEVLNIWGTGLGAIPGQIDTEPPAAGNIGPDDVTVYVGGLEVASSYHGRSPCCSGLDQIQFQVPPDITGCNVPLAVQIGDGVVSNFVTIAIASSGGACSDPDGISGSDLAGFAAQGAVSAGFVNLARTLTQGNVVTTPHTPISRSSSTRTSASRNCRFRS